MSDKTRGATSSFSDARVLGEFPEPAGPGLTCTFWPAISVGLGGRGGGCRSPSLITYCSRLTSRAQESAQLCTRTTLLEQRSSNSGWLWGGVRGTGAIRRGFIPTTHRRGSAWSSLGWAACRPAPLLKEGANGAQSVRGLPSGPRRETGVPSLRDSVPGPGPLSLPSAWPRAARYLHLTREDTGPTGPTDS